MTDPLFNDVTNEDVEQALSLLNQMEGTERYEMNTVGFLSMFKRITNQMIVIDGLLKENDALKAENKRLKHEVKQAPWQTIDTAPKDGTEVLAWREDCGVFIASYTCLEAFPLSQSEIEAFDEDVLFFKDWFTQWPQAIRLEGSEAPTHWQHLPPEPTE